jgi:hypothetical protein
MLYLSEDKKIPASLRLKISSLVDWCSRDLKIPKPNVRFYFIHKNEALYEAERKAGDWCDYRRDRPRGFYFPGEKTIWIRTAHPSVHEILLTAAHEVKHYQAQTKGLLLRMWHGDRETDAISYATYAVKNWSKRNLTLDDLGPYVDPLEKDLDERERAQAEMIAARSSKKQDQEPAISPRFILWERMRREGIDPGKFSWGR